MDIPLLYSNINGLKIHIPTTVRPRGLPKEMLTSRECALDCVTGERSGYLLFEVPSSVSNAFMMICMFAQVSKLVEKYIGEPGFLLVVDS